MPGGVLVHPGGRTIGEAEHVWLAWLTHNISDVHGNADAAARSTWGQPLVLGMLTAAVVIGLAEPAAGPDEVIGSGGAWPDGWRSIRLRAAVVAGDTLRAESRIEAVEPGPMPGAGFVRRAIIGRNQRAEVVAEIAETRLVPGRPAGSNAG